MGKYKDDNSMLVYSGASTMEKSETGELTKMIDEVTDSIKKSLDMRVHKFTAEETLDERQEIKHYFEKGLYQVITAIKCLDEGVNIPGIKTAFIMSSSRNPKEFIQRRGRLLRRSKNKKYAEIYDFITLPRDLSDVVYGDYESDRTIILGELFRMNEFAKLAENRNKTEVLITEIMNAYGVSLILMKKIRKWRSTMMDENKEINKELFDRMFKTIRTWEIKNVRNNEETDKKMVERILNYIIREVK